MCKGVGARCQFVRPSQKESLSDKHQHPKIATASIPNGYQSHCINSQCSSTPLPQFPMFINATASIPNVHHQRCLNAQCSSTPLPQFPMTIPTTASIPNVRQSHCLNSQCELLDLQPPTLEGYVAIRQGCVVDNPPHVADHLDSIRDFAL